MSDIKIGDRVVCIDATGTNELIKGREYIVYNIKPLNCCGDVIIDVGLFTVNGQYCQICNSDVSKENSTAYFRIKRFKKIEEKINYVKLEVAILEPMLN